MALDKDYCIRRPSCCVLEVDGDGTLLAECSRLSKGGSFICASAERIIGTNVSSRSTGRRRVARADQKEEREGKSL